MVSVFRHKSLLLTCERALRLFAIMLVAYTGMEARENEWPMQPEAVNFVENRGQWDVRARFCARLPGCSVWITDGGIVYDYQSTGGGHIVSMEFVGASASSVRGSTPLENASTFITDSHSVAARSFGELSLQQLYKGIDLIVHSDSGAVRYDFVIAPYTSPEAIAIRFRGIDNSNITVDSSGELTLALSTGTVRHGKLFAYQTIHGAVVPISCRFTPGKDGTIGFALGSYTPQYPLVIDPLVFSTVLGGRNSEVVQAITTDSTGCIYATGYTTSSDFPTTPGAYRQTQTNNQSDIFITKLDPTGRRLLYSTYLGGSREDSATAIAVTAAGEVLVAGSTHSFDFPTTSNALDSSYNGLYDIFYARISKKGDSLIYATYIGGGRDDYATDFAVRGDTVYLTGETNSDLPFPITPDALQRSRASAQDAFLMIFNTAGTALYYSSYFGGNSVDGAYGIAVNADGIVALAGRTSSTDLPVSANAVKRGPASSKDAFDSFIMQFNPASHELVYCTYFGGTGNDEQIETICYSTSGNLVVGGWTNSSDFPVTSTGFDTTATESPYHSGFLSVVSPDAGILSASYLNGIKGSTKIFDIALDSMGNIFCTGVTYSSSFPVTSDAFDNSYNIPSNGDSFLTYVTSNLDTILYSTFFGGAEIDAGTSVCIGPYRTAIVAGYTRSPDIPTPKGRPFVNGVDGFIASFSTGAVLLSPNNHEILCTGTEFLIEWKASQQVSVLSLAISRAGDTNTILASALPAHLHEWRWTIPNDFPGGAYRISILDADQHVLDVSDTVFFVRSRPVFTMHPISVERCPGNNVFLECNAQAFPLPAYQWQKYTDGEWKDVLNETSRFLTIYGLTPSEHNGLYRAKAITECGHVAYSDTARISTYPSPAIDIQPWPVTECPGATVSFTAHSSDPQASVQWEYRTSYSDTWMILRDETAEELILHNITESQNGWEYRAIFYHLCDNRTIPARLTVRPSPIVEEHPVSDTVCTNGKAVFSIKTSPANTTVQWQKSSNLIEWNNIPQATSTTYTTGPIDETTNGMYFRAVVRNGCETFAVSQAAQAILYPAPVLELSSTSIDFGRLGFCTNDSLISLSITNKTNVPVHFGTPVPGSKHFGVQYSPSVLDPGMSDVITVRFAPASVPVDVESILLLPAGECSYNIPITLKGQKATAPVISTASFVDFGTFPSCSTEPVDSAISISIVNTGSVEITLHGCTLRSPFTLSTARAFPIQLQPMETASFDLHYLATGTEGSDKEFVLFPFSTASSCSDTLRVEARGKRELPSVPIIDTVWFPVIPACSTGIDTVIHIVNTGNIPVSFSPDALVIGEAFLVEYPTEKKILRSGETWELPVSFRPTADGVYTGSVSFLQTPCGTTRTIEFRGRSATPRLTANATALVFSSTVRSRTIVFTNTGTIPLSLVSLEVDVPSYSIQVARSLPCTLGPDESVSAIVEYDGMGDPIDAVLRAISDSPCPIILPVEIQADGAPAPTASIAIPAQSRTIGEEFALPLLLDTTNIEALQTAGANSFRASIAFNATMMTPADLLRRGEIRNGFQIISVEGELAGRQGDTLLAVLMTTALGNASSTPVEIRSFTWFDAPGTPLSIPTTIQSGELHITDIKKGQYVNPSRSPFAIDIVPIPANETIALDIAHIPSLIGASLEVFSATGVRVDDWTQELALLPGTTSEGYGGTIHKNISALAAGVYYCRLSLWSFSLVRPFVVR